MTITDVRVSLDGTNDRVLVYCSFVIDGCFVVKNAKIVEGNHGRVVSMPNDPFRTKCPNCSKRVPVTDHFCGRCGVDQEDNRAPLDDRGYPRHYADVCHPTTAECRKIIEDALFAAYEKSVSQLKENP